MQGAASRLLPDLLPTITSDPQELTHLIYLAVNQASPAAALHLLSCFQKLHRDGNSADPIRATAEPVLDKATPLPVLQQLITTCIARGHGMVIRRLAALAAAEQVTPEMLTAWVNAAVSHGDDYTVCKLLQGFPAAGPIQSGVVASLLQSVLQQQQLDTGVAPSIQHQCGASICSGASCASASVDHASSRSSNSSTACLPESSHLSKHKMVEVICRLPGAMTLPVSAREAALCSSVLCLLCEAVQSNNESLAKHLCLRPAAALLGVDILKDLLLVATTPGTSEKVLKCLCGLPAAKQLACMDAEWVEELLSQALQQGCSKGTQQQLQQLVHYKSANSHLAFGLEVSGSGAGGSDALEEGQRP